MIVLNLLLIEIHIQIHTHFYIVIDIGTQDNALDRTCHIGFCLLLDCQIGRCLSRSRGFISAGEKRIAVSINDLDISVDLLPKAVAT